MLKIGLLFLSLLLTGEILGGVLRAPYLAWNEIRLCRSMALLRGMPLYPGQSVLGPIIGTLHTPLSHILYLPAAMLTDATAALVTCSLLAVIAVLIPLAWVMSRSPGKSVAICFLFSAFLIIESPSTYNILFMIHADAPAVGFATVACGLLMRSSQISKLNIWLAGFACALSLACKQTMAPIVIAVAGYILIAYGWRAMAQFLGAAAVGGAVLLAAILSAWPPRDVLFNIWTLASGRPIKHDALQILISAYRQTRLDALPALLPLLFISFYKWRDGTAQFFKTNCWTVFAFCGICMLPVSVKAMVTIGSDINHLGVVLYFLFAAAGLAIQQYLTDEDHPTLQLSARIFLIVGILVSIAPGLVVSVASELQHLRDNPLQVALAYDHAHPGRAYFPWNPAVSLLHDHRLYHLDPAISDREAVGYALTSQQLQTGLPEHFNLIAIPPGERLQSDALQKLTVGYRTIVDPELPSWTVLAR